MLDYSLSREQLDELRAAHRRTRDQREADRIKAVVALATGWTAEEVAELLQIDPNTVRNHFKRYRTEGLAGLNRVGEGVGGSPSLLTEEQLIELDVHLQTNLYLSAKAVAHWVEETYGVSYTESGMTAVLHRLGYVYKKPRYVPGKADREAQEQFLAENEKLQETKGKDDPIYFMDAVHPQHNPVRACGWIKRGEDQEVRTNAGRERININGAIDLDRLEPVVRFDPTIDSDSTLALLRNSSREPQRNGDLHHLRQRTVLPFPSRSGLPEDLMHPARIPPFLCAESEFDRTLLEILQEENLV